MTATLIITGASRGIGKATAELFLQQGWQVINLSRTPCSLEGVTHIETDLSDSDAVGRAITQLAELVQDTRRIALVHNAAVYCQNDTIETMTDTMLQTAVNIAITSPNRLNQKILPLMGPQSSILYIGSTLSEKAVPNAASYSIVKHAVAGMMKATCQDVQRDDFHTCCICPGFTETDMLGDVAKKHPHAMESIKKMVHAHRLIQPSEIASLVFYCAENPVVNGSVIHANLGQIER